MFDIVLNRKERNLTKPLFLRSDRKNEEAFVLKSCNQVKLNNYARRKI